MTRFEKIFIYIMFIVVSILTVFTGLIFIVSIHSYINIENSDIMNWFPDDSEIAGWALFWMIFTGISALIEIILIFFVVKLIKKIRKLLSPKFLKLK